MLYFLASALVVSQAAWLYFTYRQSEHERRERALLLDRIQAPKDAVIASALTGVEPGAEHVPLDNDDEYWKAVGERS